MRAFTVHTPPHGATRPAVILEERLAWWALLFGPLWLLRHRVWLWAGVGLVIIVSGPWQLGAAVHLICWLCGSDLRSAALARRGWRTEAIVLADDRDAALRRLLLMRPSLAGAFRG